MRAITMGMTIALAARKTSARPRPGPPPGQKPCTAATPMSATNSTVMIRIIRRRMAAAVSSVVGSGGSGSVWSGMAMRMTGMS